MGDVVSRYQSSATEPGVMDTPRWFAALLEGIHGPLGTVLDVGSAEGVMSVLAADAGATSVTGIGLHDDRMEAARVATANYPTIAIREMLAADWNGSADTVVYSMMAHWLGQDETARFARLARKHFAVIFRTANDHYAIPDNGTWFPTLAEMDATVRGVRIHESHLMTQDHDKQTWAAVYRTDLYIEGETVWKHGIPQPLRHGFDLHGDPPFRPTHGQPVVKLYGAGWEAVYDLVRHVARRAIDEGYYPSDFSPRNVIVDGSQAWLIDDEPYERQPGSRVAPAFLPIWQATLSSIGLTFTGDLRELL